MTTSGDGPRLTGSTPASSSVVGKGAASAVDAPYALKKMIPSPSSASSQVQRLLRCSACSASLRSVMSIDMPLTRRRVPSPAYVARPLFSSQCTLPSGHTDRYEGIRLRMQASRLDGLNAGEPRTFLRMCELPGRAALASRPTRCARRGRRRNPRYRCQPRARPECCALRLLSQPPQPACGPRTLSRCALSDEYRHHLPRSEAKANATTSNHAAPTHDQLSRYGPSGCWTGRACQLPGTHLGEPPERVPQSGAEDHVVAQHGEISLPTAALQHLSLHPVGSSAPW